MSATVSFTMEISSDGKTMTARINGNTFTPEAAARLSKALTAMLGTAVTVVAASEPENHRALHVEQHGHIFDYSGRPDLHG